jgi:hypothetical protein
MGSGPSGTALLAVAEIIHTVIKLAVQETVLAGEVRAQCTFQCK